MLSNIVEKVKSFVESNKTDLLVALIIFLVGIMGFGLGRLSVIWPEKEPITLENVLKDNAHPIESGSEKSSSITMDAAAVIGAQRQYVGSKSGNAYHFPWCPGAKKIKEENKIWFASKEEAERSGYGPAGNCSGLQ